MDGSEDSRDIAAFFSLLQGGSILSVSLTLSLTLMDGSLTSDASFGALEWNLSLSLKTELLLVVVDLEIVEKI